MTEVSPETGKMLALSMLRGVGPATLRQVTASSGFVDEDIQAIGERISNIGKALEFPIAWSKALERAEIQVDQAAASGARILSHLDEDFPHLLKNTRDAPYFIYVRGVLHKFPEKSVAIIGTRQPTAHGLAIVERITNFFVEHEWSIVSGLALGCDAAAHRATLSAHGHTVAVLAHGLQTVAPSSHKRLAAQILESGGALISEYGFGVEPMPTNFVKRDRTQAGLAQGVVMVQSDIQGGSLHASRAALEYGRWLAVPFPTERDRAACEPKVQANLTLASDFENEKLSLLRCKPSDLSKLRIIRTKDDYSSLVEIPELVSERPAPGPELGEQTSFL